MADYAKKNVLKLSQFGGTPYGNKSVLHFNLVTNASGVVEDSNAAAALGSGDTVRLGVLPAGMKLMDCLSIVSDAGVASSTCKIGFSYVDGVDSAAVPQDDDYFHAALSLAAIGRTRANNLAVVPVTLPKDAYLLFTHSAHTQNVVMRADFLVEGILTGQP